MSDDHFPVRDGRLIEVCMTIRLPRTATREQIDEWLRYSLHAHGGCGLDNPLIDNDPEPFGRHGFSYEITADEGVREEYGHEKRGDATYYNVRYLRRRAI